MASSSTAASEMSPYFVEDGRHFRNANADYSPEATEVSNGKINEAQIERITGAKRNMVNYMIDALPTLRSNDNSIYTGLAGNAYMFWYLAYREKDVKKRDELLKYSISLSRQSLEGLTSRHVTFLCGDAGPLVTALFCGSRSETPKEQQVQQLLNLKAVALNPRTPDEILYGRAGYLYSLMIIRTLGVMQTEVDQAIKEVVNMMFRSGLTLSSKISDDDKPPLMYRWHDTYYLGAAHGITGILYMLMHVPQQLMEYDALNKYVKPSIDWLKYLRFPSGNYPSSWNKERDKLIHWCHGAPGWIYLFLKAYEVFNEPEYLELARNCGEVIWTRGLLQKGYGICHGVAGNGYAFLALFKATGEDKHLFRALKFADFCCDYGQHGCANPDRPMSLFEGLAGTICFLQDILEPKEARFPCFEL